MSLILPPKQVTGSGMKMGTTLELSLLHNFRRSGVNVFFINDSVQK
jgi:hypothetical protein